MIPSMWTVDRDNPGPVKTLRLRLRFYAGDECLSYAKFLKALAEETTFRELIQEELTYMGPVRIADVEGAQQTIVEIVRRLEEAGDVVITGRGGETSVVV